MMYRPMNILNKIGYTSIEVDASEGGDDWDMIFGGYAHGGDQTNVTTQIVQFDWKMEHGLNAYLSQ